jgi:hypothetical protein
MSGANRCEFFGVPDVIGIEKGNPREASFTEQPVAGRSDSRVRLHDYARTHTRGDRGRFVGGSVVDDEDFGGRLGLPQRAFDRGTDSLGFVICRNYDADRKAVISHAPAVRARAA